MKKFERTAETGPDILKQQLENAGIDLTKWGIGEAKTIAHLQKELEGGETVLETDAEGKFLRKVVVGGANIYYESPDGKKFRLKEEKQVFTDGRERRRDLGHAVSEKMKTDENPREAMMRGIQEELGIDGEVALQETGTEKKVFMSPSYPGLQSQSIQHTFKALLSDTQYKSEGYIEKQSDKSTYFVWERIK